MCATVNGSIDYSLMEITFIYTGDNSNNNEKIGGILWELYTFSALPNIRAIKFNKLRKIQLSWLTHSRVSHQG